MNANTTLTSGDYSDAIIAASKDGGVNVTSYAVKTTGAYSTGIYAGAGGPVVVNSTYAATTGDHASGIVATNLADTATDTVSVTSGTVLTSTA